MSGYSVRTYRYREWVWFALTQHLLVRVLTDRNQWPHFAEVGNRGTGGLNDLLLVINRVLDPGPGCQEEVPAFSRSPLVLHVIQFLALMWPRARTQEQDWPRGEEAKSRIQHFQPRHRTKGPDLELKIQVPKGIPSQTPGIPDLEPAALFHLHCLVWHPRRAEETLSGSQCQYSSRT